MNNIKRIVMILGIGLSFYLSFFLLTADFSDFEAQVAKKNSYKTCDYFDEKNLNGGKKSTEGLEKINYTYMKDTEFIYEFDDNLCLEGIEWVTDPLGMPYSICSGPLSCKLKKIDIDIDTYEILNTYSLKDKENVYVRGEKKEYIDAPTFEILGNSYSDYSKDKDNIYHDGFKLHGVDYDSFEVDNEGDAKDAISTFIGKTRFYTDFEVLGSWYKKNEDKIFYYGADSAKADSEIQGVDYDTFEYIGGKIAMDKNSIYYEGKKLPGTVLPINYEYLGRSYGKDKNNVYDGDKILEGIVDPSSYEYVSWRYGKDKDRVYYIMHGVAKIVEGADSDSFRMYNADGSFYGQDKKNIYRYGRFFEIKQ